MCAFVRASVRIVSRASRIFPRLRMSMRKWAEGWKEKYVWANLQGFCCSFMRGISSHVYVMHINYCYLLKVLALVDHLCWKLVPVSLAVFFLPSLSQLPHGHAQHTHSRTVRTHTHALTYANTHIQTYAHTHIHEHAHTHTHAYTHALTHIYTSAHSHSPSRKKNERTLERTHTSTLTHARTHTH